MANEKMRYRYKLVHCNCCAKTIPADFNYETGTKYCQKFWCIECWLKLKYCMVG